MLATGKVLRLRLLQSTWRRCFTVLALESSADDTCAAVVTSERKILSNVVVKQNEEHAPYGGIHPLAAVHAHHRNMPGAIRAALNDAQLSMSGIDGIAFTRGPGMHSCLAVCANAAKNLAAALDKPLVGVHHMQAHALTVLLTSPESERPQFPFLTLLISGGHTLLLLTTSQTSFRTLAAAVDQAVGRVFDKVSRALELPWSTRGPGAALEECSNLDMPPEEVPLFPQFPPVQPGKLSFSFDGVHSEVHRLLERIKREGALTIGFKVGVARAFHEAITVQLEEKLVLALRQCAKNGISVRHVVVSGGVASNGFLRNRLRSCVQSKFLGEQISLVYPPPYLCTDNAVMIAWASMDRFLRQEHDNYSIEHLSKWNIEDLQT
ncbi:peptidase M22, glycoprotease [Rickenella mellea]|uniref:N(6)-L-threonylcarbamoyladenine synthase n=1 Tax=Rickenella mellea TaxID=50990 RepID=A0A4Y7QEZ4_9AGAM|nr:peptidase M22, glycoprotease [Rickenella mellea]